MDSAGIIEDTGIVEAVVSSSRREVRRYNSASEAELPSLRATQAARMTTEQGKLHSVLLTVARRRRRYWRDNEHLRASLSPLPAASTEVGGGKENSCERDPLCLNSSKHYDGTTADGGGTMRRAVSAGSIASSTSGDTTALCPKGTGEKTKTTTNARCHGSYANRRKRNGGKLRRIRKRPGDEHTTT